MADIATIDSLDAAGKKVLVRVDFNVPLKDGAVADDTRIRAALPTIQKLVNDGAKPVYSHEPSGPPRRALVTRRPTRWRRWPPIWTACWARMWRSPRTPYGEDAQAKAAALENGQVLLVENLRFDKREKKNDPEFAPCPGRFGGGVR